MDSNMAGWLKNEHYISASQIIYNVTKEMRFYYPSLWLKLHYVRFVTMNTKELKMRKITEIGVTPENISATGLANIVTGPFQFGTIQMVK